MERKILFSSLVAASLVAATFMAPIMASAVSEIMSAEITSADTSLDAEITTAGKIAKNGHDGAFGYGILTLTAFGGTGDSLIVSTTHQGVLDSAEQGGDANSPVWHNHYVQLTGAGEYCSPNTALGGARLEVAALTYESPGKVKVNGEVIQLLDMPGTFTGTNPLAGFDEITMNPGTTANAVVSFTLNVPNTADFHVCVENVS